METLLRFAILGMASGGIYALLASGVVLVYRASGVINFSAAAVAVTSAYAFFDLRTHGQNSVVCFVVALAVGIALGAAVHLLVMRPLRSASIVTKVIATLGVLVVLQSAMSLRYGTRSQSVPPYLPTTTVHIGGAIVSVDRLVILGIAVVLPLSLWAVSKGTRLGKATTAIAEHEPSLALLGWSPGTVAGLNWLAAGLLGGATGALLAPMSGITPSLATDLLVPTLAVALLAGLSSFPLAVVSALALGVLQSWATRYGSTAPVLRSLPGLPQAIPFVMIVIALVVRGSRLPDRGYVAARLPRLGTGRIRPAVVLVLATIAVVLLEIVFPDTWVAPTTTCLIAAITLLSLVVVVGLAGQVSLAQFALAGVAAFAAARLANDVGIPIPLAALMGVALCLPMGFIIGAPAVRARGVTLAIITLGLASALDAMLFNQQRWTGGLTGIPVGRVSIFGWDVSALNHPRRYATVVLVSFVVLALVVANLRRSGVGRILVAVRSNERASASLGISVAAYKLYAFVLGGAIAGVAGIFLGFRYTSAVFNGYGPFQSVNVVSEVTIGGAGYVPGALVGSALEPTGLVDMGLHNIGLGSWLSLIGGLLLILTLVTAPDGVAANVERLAEALLHRRRAGSGEPIRSLPSEDATVAAGPQSELQVSALTVRFGRVTAVSSVDLTVCSGEIVGVIGPNGAGKTTLIDAICGYVPSTGSVVLDGTELNGSAPHTRAHRGVIRSFQSLELFDDLTVAENISVAATSRRPGQLLTDLVLPRTVPLTGMARAAVEDFAMLDVLDHSPSELPYAQRRLLAIARAVACGPRILLLDEPAAGLGDADRAELRVLLRRLADDWNVGILLVEHDVELVMGTSDRVVALEFGALIASGAPDQVRNDPEVVRAYLGIDDERAAEKEAVL